MNREIKFRAWDKIEKLMVVVDEINWRSNFISGVYPKGGTSGVIKDYELLAFTGLKDKNGKEIYEGDIIKAELGIFHLPSRAIKIGQVIFMAATFGLLIKEGGKNTFVSLFHPEAKFDEGTVEIIGNIYENPELIRSLKGDE